MTAIKHILIGAGIIGVIIIAIGALTIIGPFVIIGLLTGLKILFYISIVVVPIWLLGKLSSYFYNKHKAGGNR